VVGRSGWATLLTVPQGPGPRKQLVDRARSGRGVADKACWPLARTRKPGASAEAPERQSSDSSNASKGSNDVAGLFAGSQLGELSRRQDLLHVIREPKAVVGDGLS